MSINTFTKAIVRYPTSNLCDGLTTQRLGVPNYALALVQYNAYLDGLRTCGLVISTIPSDPAFPDACFVEDPAVIYRDLVIITQPGAKTRLGESASIAEFFQHQHVAHITGEGYLDGGDVLFCADRILIGLSERTNQNGAEQLRNLLIDYDSTLRIDFVPVSGVLHLKTGVTELAPGILLRSPMMSTDYPFDFAENYYLPQNEAHGANVLPINDSALIMDGYPTVAKLAEKHYSKLFTLQMSEFEKMDGSLTCLSLRYNG